MTAQPKKIKQQLAAQRLAKLPKPTEKNNTSDPEKDRQRNIDRVVNKGGNRDYIYQIPREEEAQRTMATQRAYRKTRKELQR